MPFDAETTLRARWSKKEADIMFDYPRKTDGHLLHYHFGCDKFDYKGDIELSFLKELEKRGYDLKTFKFSIRKL